MKRVLLTITALTFLVLMIPKIAEAQVTITKPSLSISTCSYPSGYNTLNNIVIDENNNGDFAKQTDVTLILTVPTNFEFEAGIGTVSYVTGNNFTSATISVTSTTITITYTTGQTNKDDVLTISGIKIRAINSASSGNITRTGGNGTINGLTNGTTVTTSIQSTTITVPTSASASASPNPICSGQTLTLTGSAAMASTWSWTGPNGFTSSLQNPTIPSVSSSHAGVYSLTASNSCGSATAVSTSSVTVNASPTSPASIGSFTNNTTGTTVTANWTRGTGDFVLVVARFTSTSRVGPSSGSSYTANAVYGSGSTTGTGNFVVYSGTASTINVSGLTPVTGYTFDLYEFNTGNCYNTTVSSGNVTTPVLSTPMPFTEGFESGFGSFVTVNGTQANKWANGTAVAASGTKSAYISNDAGVTNAYTISTASISHMYVDLALPAGTNPFNLQFKWKCDGETSYDNLTVYMTQVTPVAGSVTEISADQIGDTYYSEQTSWQTENIELAAVTYAGQNWKLVFTWENDASLPDF